MKKFIVILALSLLITSTAFSQRNVCKKWADKTGYTYLDNVSTFPRTNITDTNKFNMFASRYENNSCVLKSYGDNITIILIGEEKSNITIVIHKRKIELIMSYYLGINSAFTKEEETQIRNYQIFLSDKIIKELNL